MTARRTAVLASTQQRLCEPVSQYLHTTSIPRTESRLLTALQTMADEEFNLKQNVDTTPSSVSPPVQGNVDGENRSVQPQNKGGSKRRNAWPPVRRKLAQTPSLNAVNTSESSASSITIQPTSSIPKPPSEDSSTSVIQIPPPAEEPVKKRGRKPKSSREDPNAHLPVYSYKSFTPAPVRVWTRHEEEANELIAALSGPLGFDLEWCVNWAVKGPGHNGPTAIVQLSDRKMILVIQISGMKKFPEKLKEIIENPKIPKLGVNILNDGQKLYRDFGVNARCLVELSSLARLIDDDFPLQRMMGLASITALYTGMRLVKGPERTSNWEKVKLSDEQLEYAANDAHCALMVYEKLMKIKEEKGSESDDLETCARDVVYANDWDAWINGTNATTASTSESSALIPSAISVPSVERTDSTASEVTTATNASSTSSSASISGVGVASLSRTSSLASALRSSTVDDEAIVISDSENDIPIPQSPYLQKDDTKNAYLSLRKVFEVGPPLPFRPQHFRAYNLWHREEMPLDEMCKVLSLIGPPLKESTVITYVVGALKANYALPYYRSRLLALIKSEPGSWKRHLEWVQEQSVDGRGLPDPPAQFQTENSPAAAQTLEDEHADKGKIGAGN